MFCQILTQVIISGAESSYKIFFVQYSVFCFHFHFLLNELNCQLKLHGGWMMHIYWRGQEEWYQTVKGYPMRFISSLWETNAKNCKSLWDWTWLCLWSYPYLRLSFVLFSYFLGVGGRGRFIHIDAPNHIISNFIFLFIHYNNHSILNTNTYLFQSTTMSPYI